MRAEVRGANAKSKAFAVPVRGGEADDTLRRVPFVKPQNAAVRNITPHEKASCRPVIRPFTGARQDNRVGRRVAIEVHRYRR